MRQYTKAPDRPKRGRHAETVKIEVDKAGGTVTDPTRIRDMLLNSGLSLVSSGAGPRVWNCSPFSARATGNCRKCCW